MEEGLNKIMNIQGADGKKHPIYGDEFAAVALTDVLLKLNELEAEKAEREGYNA